MKCNKCGSQLIINSRGEIECPVCSKTKRKITLKMIQLNDFICYKVINSLNISTPTYLLEQEVQELVNKGVEVQIC